MSFFGSWRHLELPVGGYEVLLLMGTSLRIVHYSAYDGCVYGFRKVESIFFMKDIRRFILLKWSVSMIVLTGFVAGVF